MLQKILNLFRRKKTIVFDERDNYVHNPKLLQETGCVSPSALRFPQPKPSFSNIHPLEGLLKTPIRFRKESDAPETIYPFPCDNADDEQERYTRLATVFTRRRTLSEMNIPESTFEKEDLLNLKITYKLSSRFGDIISRHNELQNNMYKQNILNSESESSSDREPYESNTDSGTDWPSMDYGDSSSSSSDNGFDFDGGSGDGGGATGEY